MSIKKQRLELTWIGKENRPRLEPRILLEDPALSHHAANRVSDSDFFDNRLIFGDNLLALKALEEEFAGKVKCIYVDPPFNTGEMFENYDDGLEHSIWLGRMRDRLTVLRSLLALDGTLFVHIDDNELGYLIVLLDEIFGRNNRCHIVTFQQGAATGHKSINPGMVSTSNFILVYAREKIRWYPNRVFSRLENRDDRYGTYIENIDDHFTKWQMKTLMLAFASHLGEQERGLKRRLGDEFEPRITEFVEFNAKQVVRLARPDYNSVGAATRVMIDISVEEPERIFRQERDGLSDIFLKGGQRILFYRDKMREIDGELVSGEPLTTIWGDLRSNNLHAEGGIAFPKGKKPESLIKRCLEIVTNPGDLVLDSFAGSGTTGAVAHKMGRRWIMIELGVHAHTHIIPRLTKVIDGDDPGGITRAVDWKGGGGYRYYKLAPSLLKADAWGRLVVNPAFNAEMLAEAVCKLEGFTYAPSSSVYWQHGSSTESDFIYVTTASLSQEQLQHLSEEVGPERTLLVACGSFRAQRDAFPNLTLTKVPQAVLDRCEWGKDDYSLEIGDLPDAPAPTGQRALELEGV